jgi:hypothetical protein
MDEMCAGLGGVNGDDRVGPAELRLVRPFLAFFDSGPRRHRPRT